MNPLDAHVNGQPINGAPIGGVKQPFQLTGFMPVTDEQCQQLVTNAAAAADQLLAMSNIQVSNLTEAQRTWIVARLTEQVIAKFNVRMQVEQNVMFYPNK